MSSTTIDHLKSVDRAALPEDGGDNFNRLIFEKSPYLLQHATNPVDWYPWGPEALQQATEKKRPLFLSIGYSTCHWCHVMAHESFEDREVAEVLQEGYIAVKVDREERPDLDQTFMTACQLLTGQGGWPLTVILTPDMHPFFAATYIPKEPRQGINGLIAILQQITKLWQEEPDRLISAGSNVAQEILAVTAAESRQPELSLAPVEAALRNYRKEYDAIHGGFGQAPKFPAAHTLSFLLLCGRHADTDKAREPGAMALHTLEAMRLGGLFDQVGLGFHRYSVDAFWRVPHFEKMLYDQAVLLDAYLDGWLTCGDPFFAETAREIRDYIAERLRLPNGGFACGEDADTEGGEGLFYLWTPEEARNVLPRDLHPAIQLCGMTEEGDLDGRSVPHLKGRPSDSEAKLLGQALPLLKEQRELRVAPHLDDKVLTGWNGLMVGALARAARLLNDETSLRLATASAAFIWDHLRSDEKRLMRRYREGQIAVPAFLEDYAFMAQGTLELFLATQDPVWIQQTHAYLKQVVALFSDQQGGYFDVGQDAEIVLQRGQTVIDGAHPSGGAVLARVFLRMGRLTGDTAWLDRGEKLLLRHSASLYRNPTAHPHWLQALHEWLYPGIDLVLAVPKTRAEAEMVGMLREFQQRDIQIQIREHQAPSPLKVMPRWQDKNCIDQRPTAWICTADRCLAPIVDPEELRQRLKSI